MQSKFSFYKYYSLQVDEKSKTENKNGNPGKKKLATLATKINYRYSNNNLDHMKFYDRCRWP